MRILIALLVVSLLGGAAAARAEVPRGWVLTGSDTVSYTLDLDSTVTHGGRSSARLQSHGIPKGFGAMAQSFDAGQYHGKRVRFSAWVRSEQVGFWAGLWMRVDGTEPGQILAFDNMYPRPIRGTNDWQRYSIVLDVEPKAARVVIGALVAGQGTLWIDDVRVEKVGRDVPVTDLRIQSRRPANLGFEH